MGDAAANHVFGAQLIDRLAREGDLTARTQHPADRAQCRGLPGAVGTQDCRNTAGIEREGDAMQHLARTVERFEIGDLEQRNHHAGLPR